MHSSSSAFGFSDLSLRGSSAFSSYSDFSSPFSSRRQQPCLSSPGLRAPGPKPSPNAFRFHAPPDLQAEMLKGLEQGQWVNLLSFEGHSRVWSRASGSTFFLLRATLRILFRPPLPGEKPKDLAGQVPQPTLQHQEQLSAPAVIEQLKEFFCHSRPGERLELHGVSPAVFRAVLTEAQENPGGFPSWEGLR